MLSSTLLAASGLLALVSAAPASLKQGPCEFGASLGVIRFDDLTPDTEIPNGYAGFDWPGLTVTYAPRSNASDENSAYPGSTPQNVIQVSNKRKYGGQIILPGSRSVTYGIKSFNAICVVPHKRASKAVDCSFQVMAINGDSTSIDNFKYTVSKYEPFLETFAPGPGFDSKYYQFDVTSGPVEGVKPTLLLDNVLVERSC